MDIDWTDPATLPALTTCKIITGVYLHSNVAKGTSLFVFLSAFCMFASACCSYMLCILQMTVAQGIHQPCYFVMVIDGL